MIALFLLGIILAAVQSCSAGLLHIGGIVVTHAGFNTEQTMEMLVYEELNNNLARYSICDIYPTEARFIEVLQVVYHILS